ncbi:OLC1v1026060C1 [Oldenlandia corymbosa var. corymbosa]|uniref:OLC1v1026060C1 n=1 Tax=Oldenlandia corymbosa var. corymbosa TaxID=529605 RepID=A0AAV1C8J0_OLDCO|nr:OLC1v1026060C1 [Oldenlandia corymbosa var. corymbosa]
MCKSKNRLSNGVTEPSSTMAKQRRSTSQKTVKSQKSSTSTDPLSSFSNYNSIQSTGSSYYNRDSWATASNSGSRADRSPLSRLRDNLPEQPHIYDISEISAATHNFSMKPFSSSSTSTSWRCTVRGQEVMLIQRKFRRRLIDVAELGERLALICRSHHSSLVKLKGASITKNNYIYLVYEFIHGGNLAECLRNPRNPSFTVLSDWMSRVKIAHDIAHGLDYIHHSTGLGRNFVHNHIKSSSIIITDGLNPKICHFGTADLCGEIKSGDSEEGLDSKSKGKTELKRPGSGEMKLEGTRGYMAPEFKRMGLPSEKTDVYAFGVVILELLSGREPMKYKFDEQWGGYVRESLIETAKEAVAEGGGGGVRRWVDKRMKDSYPVEVVERLVKLALECVSEDPGNRPDMGWVVVRISQWYLESQTWVEKMGGLPTDFSVSLAPR